MTCATEDSQVKLNKNKPNQSKAKAYVCDQIPQMKTQSHSVILFLQTHETNIMSVSEVSMLLKTEKSNKPKQNKTKQRLKITIKFHYKTCSACQ